MEPDKLSKWLEMAKQFSGDNFWSEIFGPPEAESAPQPSRHGEAPAPQPAAGPLTDVLQTDREILILVDLPGVSKEDVVISLSGGQLHLNGMVKPPFPDAAPITTERFSGPLRRTIRLPEPVSEASRIEAAFRNGLLIIRIPLQQEPHRHIPID